MNIKKISGFLGTVLILALLHYLGMMLFGSEANSIITSLLYGLLFGGALYFLPISYSKARIEKIIIPHSGNLETIGQNCLRQLNGDWDLIEKKEGNNRIDIKLKSKGSRFMKNEWLNLELIDLKSEIKIIATLEYGEARALSHAKKKKEKLQEVMNSLNF